MKLELRPIGMKDILTCKQLANPLNEKNLFDAEYNRKKQDKPSRKIVFDGDFEANLIQMACSDPPEGFCRWTVRLLAEKLVELKIVPKVSAMTVQRVLKKTKQSLT